jgi:DNA polymerase IV
MNRPSSEPDRLRREETLEGDIRSRRILLVDCDAFFVQVARLEDPEGAGRAELLMVGGSPEGRGVVTSADYGVREFGVRSGMPMARAVQLCPRATVVPVPRAACARRSRDVHQALRALAPVVQAASIDEFYLDVTGTERLYGNESLTDTALRIREAVLERTGISVSVGGGTVRLVAKLAVERAKPAGVHVVPAGQEEAFLLSHELSEIPGVGPALLDALHERGLRTVDQLVQVEAEWLRRWFGPARGRWLWERARGIDPSPVTAVEDRKSVSAERTFPRDIDSDDDLERRLLELAVEVGSGLRRRGLRTRTVTVKLRDADFTTRQASRTLPQAIQSDTSLFRVAAELLADLRARRRRPARLLGVGASTLEGAEDPRQLTLLELEGEPETERDRAISRTLDQLRDRFGPGTIVPARIVRPPKEGPAQPPSPPHRENDE